MSAKYINKRDNKNEITGATSHIIKNLLTEVFLKIFLKPSFATPIPIIAPTFNCTSEVGMPFVNDANKSKLAETNRLIQTSRRLDKLIA